MQEKLEEYGEETFIESEKTNGVGEKERKAVEYLEKLSRDGFEKVMTDYKLDALVGPGISLAMTVLPIGGYPGISVPAGYQSNGVPFGICFGGLKGTEPKLIEIAYAFQQAMRRRKPPIFLNPVIIFFSFHLHVNYCDHFLSKSLCLGSQLNISSGFRY